MKTVFRWLVVVVVVLHFLAPAAYAGWRNKMAGSERRAAEYISLLKAGEDPGSIERPTMRHFNHYQAKHLRKMLVTAMDDAEILARVGRQDEIRTLERITNDSYERTSTYSRRSTSNY